MDDNREDQDSVVDAANDEGCTDTLEGLPSEQLNLNFTTIKLGHRNIQAIEAYLHESPGEESGDQQSDNVQYQTGDFGVSTTLPVVRQQVGLARTIDGQLQEVFTELTCVPDLETTPGGGEDVGEEGGEAMITHENSYIISCVKKVTSAYM